MAEDRRCDEFSRELAAIDARTPELSAGIRAAFRLLSRRERRQIVLVFASMLVNAALGLAGVASILPFAYLMLDPDPLGGGGSLARLLSWLGVSKIETAIVLVGTTAAMALLIKNAYSFLHLHAINRFSVTAEIRLACALLDRILGMPFAWLTRQNAAVLHNIIVGRTVEWSRGVIRITLTLLTEIIFLVLLVVLLAITSPAAGLIVSSLALACSLGLLALARPWIQRSASEKTRWSRLSIITAREAVVGGRDIRMGVSGDVLSRMFRREFTSYAQWDTRGRLWQALPRHGIEVVGVLALIGFAFAALTLGLTRFEVGALLALYAMVAIRAVPATNQIVQSLAMLRGTMPALAELLWLVDATSTAPEPNREPAPETGFTWRLIEMHGVGVRYAEKAVLALEGVELRLERGRRYGIVGSSGAGKSTLVDVLAGLVAPSTGEVLIDGKRLDAELATAWRRHVAYVTQTPVLFDATLAENVVFGAAAAAEARARLEVAVTQAGLADLVATIPGGLDARCGDGALALSGGQRQRVAIARALFRRADLLLLDEATSALDSLTEGEIQESIRLISQQVTVVVIAHRLSTVRECDEIIVMDRGRIVASGSHDCLMNSSPHYRRLVEAQSLATTDS